MNGQLELRDTARNIVATLPESIEPKEEDIKLRSIARQIVAGLPEKEPLIKEELPPEVEERMAKVEAEAEMPRLQWAAEEAAKRTGKGLLDTMYGIGEAARTVATGIPAYILGVIGQTGMTLYDLWKIGFRDPDLAKALETLDPVEIIPEALRQVGRREPTKEKIAEALTYPTETRAGEAFAGIATAPFEAYFMGVDEIAKLTTDDPDVQKGIRYLADIALIYGIPKAKAYIKRTRQTNVPLSVEELKGYLKEWELPEPIKEKIGEIPEPPKAPVTVAPPPPGVPAEIPARGVETVVNLKPQADGSVDVIMKTPKEVPGERALRIKKKLEPRVAKERFLSEPEMIKEAKELQYRFESGEDLNILAKELEGLDITNKIIDKHAPDIAQRADEIIRRKHARLTEEEFLRVEKEEAVEVVKEERLLRKEEAIKVKRKPPVAKTAQEIALKTMEEREGRYIPRARPEVKKPLRVKKAYPEEYVARYNEIVEIFDELKIPDTHRGAITDRVIKSYKPEEGELKPYIKTLYHKYMTKEGEFRKPIKPTVELPKEEKIPAKRPVEEPEFIYERKEEAKRVESILKRVSTEKRELDIARRFIINEESIIDIAKDTGKTRQTIWETFDKFRKKAEKDPEVRRVLMERTGDSLRVVQEELRAELKEAKKHEVPRPGLTIKPVRFGVEKPKFAFENTEIETRFEAAKGQRAPSVALKAKSAFSNLWHKMSRTYKDLPYTAEFSPAKTQLKMLEKQRAVAWGETVEILDGITIKADAYKHDLFRRRIILNDLAHEAKLGRELPFGFTKELLAKEKGRLDLEVNKHPDVIDAIAKRKRVNDSMNKDYIYWQERIGHHVEERMKKPDYFRHQVLDYAQIKSLVTTGKKLKIPTRRGWLRKRKGSEYDINTDYLQAEAEVMSQKLYDIEVAKTLDFFDNEYSIYDRVKASAKKQSFENWEDAIPEGYEAWQPREGNVFYLADTLPERIARQILEGELKDFGVVGEKLNKVLAMGSRRRSLVIKSELAKTLNDLVQRVPDSTTGKINKKVLRAWKRWVLLSPRRFVKFNIRNMTGDADAAFVGNAHGFTKVPRAFKELCDTMILKKPMTQDMRDFVKRGGLELTLQAQEIGSLRTLENFKRFYDRKGGVAKIPKNIVLKYWKMVRIATDFREQILRYANYLDYTESVIKSPKGRPRNFGASIPEEIMALKDPRDKAFRLSNELLGAYDEISHFGQTIRQHVYPFWCVPVDTEILTKDGWKFYNSVKIGDTVLTYSMKHRTTSWESLKDIAVFDFDDSLVTIKNKRGHKFRFTKNHRIPIIQYYKNRSKIVEAQNLKTHHFIPIVAEHSGFPKKSILTPKESALLGWIITDGYHRKNNNSSESVIYQSPLKHTKEIREQFKDWITSEAIHPQTGVICFRITNKATKNIEKYLNEKSLLPSLVCRLDKASLEAMLDAMIKAEAHTSKTFTHFTQNSVFIMDTFQIICYLLGKGLDIRKIKKGQSFGGDETLGGHVKRIKRISLYKWRRGETPYKGKVWCPVTSNGTWIMRQEGRVLITGNSWKELNFRRYVRLLKNAVHSDNATSVKVARSILPIASMTGRTAIGFGRFAIKATGFWTALQVWNHVMFPDIEAELPDHVTGRAHINLGRDKDGKAIYFTRIGALGDFLEWFGLDAAPNLVSDYLSGKKSLKDIGKEMIRAPVNQVAQGLHPGKGVFEILLKKSLFPDAFEARTIRDKGLHIARSLALDDEYKAIMGKPSEPYRETLPKAFVYKTDLFESAYYQALDIKNEFLEKVGRKGEGFRQTPRGDALYKMKMAHRYGDKKLEKKYLEQYISLHFLEQKETGKSTDEIWKSIHRGVTTSLNAMNPLFGLSKHDKTALINSLNPEERELFAKAIRFYFEVLRGTTKLEED